MKLLRNLTKHHEFDNGVVAAIGNFDGVHLGHQHLLKALSCHATQKNMPMLVVIFEPQAREFFTPNNAPPRISPFRDKLRFLRECGVDYVLCLRFNSQLASIIAADFAEKILFTMLNVKHLLVGNDFKFGKDRQGCISFLKDLSHQYNCVIETCNDYLVNDARISSTAVRKHLLNAELEEVVSLLGRRYSLSGRVVSGDGQARKWGFPTANIRITQLSLALKGVYCVQVKLKKGIILPGVANIGLRPTVAGKRQILEVHIFNFSDSLYGELVEVFFLKKLREEIKFASIDDLVNRIKIDVALAKEYFLIN